MKRLSAVVVFVIFVFVSVQAQVLNEQMHKFGRVITLINTLYVDSVSEAQLVESAIIEMLKDLDPHSVYISADEVAKMNEPLEGSFEGIGIQFRITDDTLIVSGIISGGPSEKVGIEAGDRIVAVDGKIIAGVGLKNEEVVKMLRGDKGTIVSVEVLRPGVAQKLDFSITRDKIPLFSVDAGYISKEGIGYIKLNKFSKTTMEELNEVFDSFQKAKVNKIILDLSDNTGGYLDQSIQLVDEFMSDKQMVVYTEGAHSPRQEYRATTKGRFDKCKLVVIVDEGSASASEITSGAIQDWDRGVIVGRRTFGKGLVQRPFSLPDGSMIRLTVSRYYTPSGRLIQKPYSDDYDEYSSDIVNRYKHGEFSNADSISFPDSLKHETLINKRIVYGGGGIMPDVFVPLDTVMYGEYHYALLRKGLLFRFVNKYVDSHRDFLKKNYPDVTKFESSFTVDDNVLKELNEYARQNQIVVDSFANPTEIQKYRMQIHIKALIAGELWKTNEFYRIFNEINPNYNEARAVLLDDKRYDQLLKNQKK
ncbi:MAG TPA: S41 family peptidase [Bacteroidales bacterium]|nr:S41 family peptidase [Bacteroidales bacterium]HOE05349.1 S41 family peptidase [Bacteroidales bacterium]